MTELKNSNSGDGVITSTSMKVRPRRPWYHKHFKVWQLYVMIALPVALLIVFSYIPILGNVIAFQNFSIRKGFHSPFVGLKYFKIFLNLPIFWDIIRNTVLVSVYSIIVGFPFPIILALAFNELTSAKVKKTIQTITYAPFFISTVVMVSIVMQVLSYRFGVINEVIKIFGGNPVNFIAEPGLFRSIYVWSGVWQMAGYQAVLYIAALSSVDPTLYEAAIIDGTTKFQRMLNIDIPSIMPTIIITFILSTGGILSVGFEKVFLLQNPGNYKVSEVISTYVYKIGIQQAQFSLSAAIGLFNAVVNFVLLFTVNQIAKKVSDISLF